MPSKIPWLALIVLLTTFWALPAGGSAVAGELAKYRVAAEGDMQDLPVVGEPTRHAAPAVPCPVPEEERGGKENNEWDDVDAADTSRLGGAGALRLRRAPEQHDEHGEDHRWRDLKPPR